MKHLLFFNLFFFSALEFCVSPTPNSFANSPAYLQDPSCEDALPAETLNPRSTNQVSELKRELDRTNRTLPKSGVLKGASLKELNILYGTNPIVQKTMAAAYEGSKIRRNMGREAIGSKATDHGLGRCYMYTQIFAKKGGLTADNRWVDETGVSAKNAGPALKRRGFVNLMEMPEYREQMVKDGKLHDLPMGALLVYDSYEGTTFGHIEMKTNRGFVSDYASVGMRTRTASDKKAGIEGSVKARGRTLIGVYIKPSLIEDQL